MLCLTLILAGQVMPGQAQTEKRVVSGTVREANGPLAKATISEKGMPANATSSGPNGEFHLTLKGASSIIIISFVNFASQEIRIKDPR